MQPSESNRRYKVLDRNKTIKLFIKHDVFLTNIGQFLSISSTFLIKIFVASL